MEPKNDCMYCVQDQQLRAAMTEVCRLKSSIVYLLNDQAFRGRCVVAYHRHATELFELSQEERQEYLEEVTAVAATIQQVFQAQKMNYAVLGDVVPHLHFHLIPRNPEGPLFGQHFFVRPVPPEHLPAAEFEGLLTLLRRGLE